MIEGACHCGTIGWSFDGVPEGATICNCSLCRRYGVLWAYDYEDERIRVRGESLAYRWGTEHVAFHFCAGCGCVGWWRAVTPGPDGRRRIAVNLRLAAPDAVGAIPLDRFDGQATFEDLPRDGRCVADVWF